MRHETLNRKQVYGVRVLDYKAMRLQGYEDFTENYGCHGEKLGKKANAEAGAKVGGGQRSIVGADIRFINEFAEIDMRTSKPTI